MNDEKFQRYRLGVIAALAHQTKPITRKAIEASLAKDGVAKLYSDGRGKRVDNLSSVRDQLIKEGLIEYGPKEGNALTYLLTAKGRKIAK